MSSWNFNWIISLCSDFSFTCVFICIKSIWSVYLMYDCILFVNVRTILINVYMIACPILGRRSYGSLIYNYLCNQCLSPLKLWVWIPLMQRCTRYNVMWYSLPVTCGRSVVFSGYSCFLYQWNWPPRCGWNIVWSGIKPHNHNTILDTVVRTARWKMQLANSVTKMHCKPEQCFVSSQVIFIPRFSELNG